jgi:hypothetical protein
MTNALTSTEKPVMGSGEWSTMKEQASMLIKTGFLPPSIKTPEQVIAIALTGRELGIGMMEAIRGINVIQGKPSVSPQLMLALAIRTGQMESYSMKSDPSGATVTIKRKGWPEHFAKFGPTEAKALGLDGKDNYRKQASVMYQWRALAQGLRFTFPDAVSGIYTFEEMGADVKVEDDGSISVKAEAPQPSPSVQMPQEKPAESVQAELIEPDLIAQKRMLFKVAESAWTKETYKENLREYLRAKFNTEHTSDMTPAQLDEAIKNLKQAAMAAHANSGA